MTHHDDDDVQLLTPAEAADRLRLGRTKTYELLQSGQIRSIKIGDGKSAARRIPISALREFIDRNLEAAK